MASTFLVTILIIPVFIQGRTEVEKLIYPKSNHTHLDVYANALGKAHYNAWTCNYSAEPGYKCLSCSAALHCYPGNFALLVQCAGLFPNCRNGYCSLWRTEGCNEDYMFAEGTHGPLRVTTSINDKITISLEESTTSGVTESVPDINPVPTDSNKVEELITSSTEPIENQNLKPNNEKDPR